MPQGSPVAPLRAMVPSRGAQNLYADAVTSGEYPGRFVARARKRVRCKKCGTPLVLKHSIKRRLCRACATCDEGNQQ